MYMDFDFDKNDLVFTMDKTGVLKGGGFVINSDLLKDTLYSNSNTVSSLDGANNIQSGGSVSVSASILNTFKDLAVPAGLFFTQKQVQKNNTIKYDHKQDAVEDGLYDKLLSMLEPERRMLHGRKTKRKREIHNRKTRKERM
jgi:hypothetical protein